MISQKRLSAFKPLGIGLVLICSYVFFGLLGINLVILPNTQLTLIWFASGIGLIAFRIFGNRAFFLVLLASLGVNFPFYLAASHFTFPVTLVLGILVSAGDVLQSFFACKISLQIEKRLGRPLFEKGKDIVLYFFLVCTLPAAITCWFFVLVTNFLGGLAFDITGFLRETGYLTLSDALGLLLIGPLYWAFKYRNVLRYKNIFTRIFLNSLSFLILLFSLFWQPLLVFFVFPIILLCSTYPSLIDAALSSFCLALLMAVGTAKGLGLFVNTNPVDSFFNLVLFLLVVVFMRYYLTLIFIDEKNREELLQRTEVRYRHIVDSAAVGVFQIKPDSKVLFANSTILSLLEYESIEDINSHGGAPILYKDPKDREALIRIIGTKGWIDNYEIDFVTKNKKPVAISLNMRLEKDILYGTLTNITERKRAEEEKAKLEGQLLQAHKMEAVGTLAGGIAHDFNNLLMGIMGYTSLMLMKTDKSHPFYEKLKSIERLVESGADLTRQLLGFARGGKYEVKPVDANDLIITTSEIFGRTKKEITIHRKLQEHLHTVEIDRGQIEQALLNLYVNAWQAMPSGGELYLETNNVVLNEQDCRSFGVKPGPYVKISVTDTGVGMDAETRQRIFEPFFTTKDMGRGTGLGLASAYGIIKNHGGIITVESEKGYGSTFTLYLSASEKEIPAEAKPEDGITPGYETILIVDDEAMNIESLKELLETLGYKTFTASNGLKAIELYREYRKDIHMVILDMIMPGMNGRETFLRLKEIDAEAKVLLSSGYSINGEATNILDLGCSGFIQKPFGVAELSQKIRTMLDS
ncbi:MAG: response regulator [Desulfobulbaceae bacterium]|nr:response regulator [Desulfobulbaceae bacterium]